MSEQSTPAPGGKPPAQGTHQGHLDPEARERRRIKTARYRQNRLARAEENRNRGSRT